MTAHILNQHKLCLQINNAETCLWSDISSFPCIGNYNRNLEDLGLDLVLNMVNCLGANMLENGVKGDLNNNIEVRPEANMSKNGIEGDLNNNLEERTGNNKEIASSRNFILRQMRQMLVENENFNAQQKTTGQNLDIDVNSNFHTGKLKRTHESCRMDYVAKSNSSRSESSYKKWKRPNMSKEKKNLSNLNREEKNRNYLDRDTLPDIPIKKRKIETYNDMSMFETSQMDSETLDHNNKHLGSDSQNMKKGVLNVTDQTKGAVVDVNNNKEKKDVNSSLRLDNVNEQRRSLRKSTEIMLKKNKRLSSAASLKSSDFKIVRNDKGNSKTSATKKGTFANGNSKKDSSPDISTSSTKL